MCMGTRKNLTTAIATKQSPINFFPVGSTLKLITFFQNMKDIQGTGGSEDYVVLQLVSILFGTFETGSRVLTGSFKQIFLEKKM